MYTRPMRVLLVGSGGREHALAWKLRQSPQLSELHAAPGNPGIGELAVLHPVGTSELEAMTELVAELAVDLVVVGPEAPLAAGLGDRLVEAGVACFGPGAAASRIESSKAFAKTVMRSAGVPTARAAVCDTVAAADVAIAESDGRVVIKADGLAAGKGVTVCSTAAEAQAAARECLVDARFGTAGRRVLVEERLDGDELSLLALCDPEAQAILPRLDCDLLDLLSRAATGSLAGASADVTGEACVSVVVAADGYPEAPVLGGHVEGIDAARALDGVSVFHAGTGTEEGRTVVTGGGIP